MAADRDVGRGERRADVGRDDEPVEGLRVSVFPVLAMDRLRPPPSSGSHGGYARSFLATLLLILSVVGAATSTLDPFGIHRWIEVPGINAHKPATHARVRMFKAYEVER